MESKPITSSGHEASIDRRQTLYKLAKLAAGLLAIQVTTVLRPFPASIAQTVTENSKGEEMNQDRSQALDDPYRPPRHILPTRYDLRLEPDVASATFVGRASIAVTVIQPTTVIVLNALDLTIESAAVEAEQGRHLSAVIEMDE